MQKIKLILVKAVYLTPSIVVGVSQFCVDVFFSHSLFGFQLPTFNMTE